MKHAVISLIMLFTASAHSAIIFEDDFGTGSNQTVSTSFGNWLVTSGNVDLWNFGSALPGISIDLGGTNANGTIVTKESFVFDALTTYELSFLLGNNTNPNGSNGILFGLFDVSGYSQSIADISYLSSTVTQWVTFTFTAAEDFEAAIFFTTTGPVDNSGAIVDNVSLKQVPTPATIGLLGLSLLFIRKFRKH
ncbi:hypothetical protein [Alteromonas sp. CYL-A6]|uniref:hypothetical protein n=1 Tax=Alteromonas nitratireducens TaxID=3390813 RepID=UPI0034AE7B40